MPPLTPLLLLLLLTTLLPLTTSTPTNTNTSTPSPAAASTLPPQPASPSSLAAASLPGGTASPPLTLFMYGDLSCTYVNSTYTSLTNALPLSYDAPSPQYPFWAFVMTRNLTQGETLTFYSSSNTSAGACGVPVGNLTEADGGAGWCLPVGGATCYNLTRE
ncbi:hypothetical protein IMSHALPRED_011115 [Imshaugia aleurites]|uniref:Pherophorin domain-containing protein n=1 Tax=Imshaugia aleurites TaxID=172621 RepID=A0A8H3IX58_9LECA|nr:hypothetical protein IMSHALPRED_011115 [Imshaugia aleurites]